MIEDDMNEYREIVKRLKKYDKAYRTGEAMVSDTEYDELFKMTTLLETHLQEHLDEFKVDHTSPTQMIGRVSKRKKLKHLTPMYSMKDAFNVEEMSKWLVIVNQQRLIIMPKFDGISLNIQYRDGILYKGIIRGDGIYGEDVTDKLKYISDIPETICEEGIVDVQGEVTMRTKVYLNLLDGGYKFKNPRNAVAGSMMMKDLILFKERGLNFIPWGYGERIEGTHEETLDRLTNLGFKSYKVSLVDTMEQIQERFEYYDDNRDAFQVDCDGLAIRINDNKMFEGMGTAHRVKKGIIAYKFSTVEKVTTVTDIILQVGRTGTLTPVAIVEPTELDGALVTKATLHNWDVIDRLGIGIGAKVLITRSGGVIPKILSVVHSKDLCPIPTHCPICNSSVSRLGSEFICSNHNCSGKNIQKILYFGSRDRMDISGLGPSLVNTLYSEGIVKGINDIYRLTYDKLLSVNTGDKTARNILGAIDDSRGVELSALLGALGIKTAGNRTWEKILPKIDDIFTLTYDELITIPQVGKAMAHNILEYLDLNRDSLRELIELVGIKEKERGGKLSGKKFYITGKHKYSRGVIVKAILDQGGLVRGSISKSIDIALVGDSAPKHKIEELDKLDIVRGDINDVIVEAS